MSPLTLNLYYTLLWAWLALAAVVFVLLQVITAPYGRHTRRGWGPAINRTVGWVLMEAPSPLLMVLLFALGRHTTSPVAIVFLGMWLGHYIHRAFIFPFRLRGGTRQMPLVIALMALCFNLCNGYFNGHYLFFIVPEYSLSWLLDGRFILGVLLFFVGFVINQHADAVLLRLRRSDDRGYTIPHGGLYRWVSCPNYLGEMIEWWGWALATWSLAGLTFAAWTVANLLPRARAHHRWYLDTFEDYPDGRRAVIPFLL